MLAFKVYLQAILGVSKASVLGWKHGDAIAHFRPFIAPIFEKSFAVDGVVLTSPIHNPLTKRLPIL